VQPPQYCAAGEQLALALGATSASVCPGPWSALTALQCTSFTPQLSASSSSSCVQSTPAPAPHNPSPVRSAAPSAAPGGADTTTRPPPQADHPVLLAAAPGTAAPRSPPHTRAQRASRGRAVHQAPGPSDYEPRGAFALPAKRAHTLAGRHAPRAAEAAPGPGTYAPRGASRLVGAAASAPAFSMRSRPRDACAPAHPNMTRRAWKVVAAA
jgi:hypothetical protein